jgi:acyl carrier protein
MTETLSAGPPTRERVIDGIRTAVSGVLATELPPIDERTRLFDDLSLDSTSVLELLMEIEDGLGVELDADTLEQHHFETVGTLTDYILEQAT